MSLKSEIFAQEAFKNVLNSLDEEKKESFEKVIGDWIDLWDKGIFSNLEKILQDKSCAKEFSKKIKEKI